ncbi:MAG: sugar kinase [Alicyclobacillaceae bacterium]|nr:sugar kinase [Alicyclobacillaceae bacterium]
MAQSTLEARGRDGGRMVNQARTTEVATFGEVMTLFYPTTVDPLRFAHRFAKTVAGAESNVAVGLARLGHRVNYLTKLGDDEFGRFVHHFLRGEGVDTRHVTFHKTAPTGVFFKQRQPTGDPQILYYRNHSAASTLAPSDIPEEFIASARYLHLTGITPALSATAREATFTAAQMAREHGTTVVLDPNIRRKLWSAEEAQETLLRLAQWADIVLPGIDEGRLLTGRDSAEEMAAEFLNAGARLVVVKLGQDGAYYRTNDTAGTVPAHPVPTVVDPVGAGDAFAAGLLSGLLREQPLPDAVALATRVAARVIEWVGDVEGLPTWQDITEDDERITR